MPNKTMGISKKKKTIPKQVFRRFKGIQSRLTDLLSEKPHQQP